MKNKVLMLCAAIACGVASAFAETCTVDGVVYTYTVNDGGASIRIASASSANGEVVIPSSVDGYPVTALANSAFYNCTNLVAVTIPDSVISIGSQAFDGCQSLSSLLIPNSVANIGWSAFGRSGIQEIEVDQSNETFCAIDGVLFSKDRTKLLAYPGGRQGWYEIPNEVTTIGAGAFSGCTNLVSIGIPENVTVANRAFEKCYGLRAVGLSPSLVQFEYAFYGCTNLVQVDIPEGITNIDKAAFLVCENLRVVNFPPSGLKRIGTYAFGSCRRLENVSVPEGVASIDAKAFSPCGSLQRINLPDSLQSIGYAAFYGCTNLEFVTIPANVTNIEKYAFGWTSLRQVTLQGVPPAICATNAFLAEGEANSRSTNVVGCFSLEHYDEWEKALSDGTGRWCGLLMKKLPPFDYSVKDEIAVYDGMPHGIQVVVTNDAAGNVTFEYAETKDGPWVSELAYTNACPRRTVYYRISECSSSAMGSAWIEIFPRVVPLVSSDQSVAYGNGMPELTMDDRMELADACIGEWLGAMSEEDQLAIDMKQRMAYELDPDGSGCRWLDVWGGNTGFVVKDGAWYCRPASSDSGHLAEIGSHTNSFAYKFYECVNTNNYVILEKYGTLTVVPRRIALTSESALKMYDGMPLEKDAVSISGDGLLNDDELYCSAITSIWNVGSATNEISYAFGDDVTASHYVVTKNEGLLTIAKRPVTITSGTKTDFVYDGNPHGIPLIIISGTGFVAGEGIVTSNWATVTTVAEGEVANTFDYAAAAGTDLANYDITVVTGKLAVVRASVVPASGGDASEPGDGTLDEGALSKFDATFVYDGEGHTIKTNELCAAFASAMGAMANETKIWYAVGEKDESDGASAGSAAGGGTPALPSEGWSLAAPEFTNVCEEVVWYKVTNPNYEDYVHAAKVTIAKRPVTITSGTKTDFVYDGNPHGIPLIIISGTGFVAGEGIVTSNWATVTTVAEGEVANTFDYAAAAGTDLANYDITTLFGTLAVTKRKIVDETADSAVDPSSASTYNGYLYDDEETPVGTIQAKVAKARLNRKTRQLSASVTVAILVAGEKKISLRGTLDVESGAIALKAKDGRLLDLQLGANGLRGAFGDYVIDGARDVFSSKATDDKTRANAALAKWQGALAIVSDMETFSVTIYSKGKTRITGVLADGTKISTSAQMIVGETCSCIPAVISKRTLNLAFGIWLGDDGETVEVVGLGEDVVCGRPGALADGAAFRIDAAALCELLGDDTFAAYLPDGVPVVQKGTKWIVADGAKTGRVVLGKGGEVDEDKAGANPSALRFSYRAKDGSFTGSFKAYVLYRGRPKATTVTVSGVVIDGVGYGTATIRKVGSVAVRIE